MTPSVVQPKRGQAAATRNAVTRRRKRLRNLIDDVTAVLLISADAKGLSEFYQATLGLPMKEERHDGIRPHYGHSLGDVHFAIHSAES